MWKYLKIFIGFYLIVITKCSLLELSQSMWNKFLAGGLSKVGQLDPLRVPMVKVDQSEGNTSYRMVLRNIEISGLNDSTIESIHVARGKLRSNLSDLEAGFVTYSDLGDLESIRYKFHTVVNNMRKETRDVEVAASAFNSSKFEKNTEYLPRYSDSIKTAESNSDNYEQQQQQQSSRLQERRYRESQEKLAEVTTDSAYLRNLKIEERLESHRSTDDKSKYPSSVHVIYAQSSKNMKINQETYQKDKNEPDCYDYSDPRQSSRSNGDQGNFQTSKLNPSHSVDFHASASDNKEIKLQQPTERTSAFLYANQRRDYQRNGNVGENVQQSTERSDSSYSTDQQRRNYHQRNNNDGRLEQSTERSGLSYNVEQRRDYQSNRNEGRLEQSTERSGSLYYADQRKDSQESEGNVEGKIKRMSQRSESIKTADQRLENKPGYIDIVYADEKNSSGVKRFGNMRLQANRETKVYGFEDVMKDIRDNRRILVHNFTEGESLTKKNDRVRAALEAKRLKDLARYAANYEEREGYFEEGMELIYHYGGMGNESKEIKRVKRAHPENDSEDDVMHVIMRIHVPLLRIKSEYMLTGKVGEEVLRGNGLLAGNFTELHGDFTVELKKGTNDSMIVRATRAKLSAKDKKIDLQGMDEEGPVKSILTQGLMAAEAVAAMLADDLTTKALSEKTADAMVYRMYNDLPMIN
ncbi:PREDICTED: uncharacterized protein LOC106788707 [Polistes canadensis]|uniref:uncharacterized protein LOC106788707 n=1 Tax=Polistes canadensis TaxID=91411 RepID=UPI000718B56E|nr:PREDICTED: uncharacterized protein LOC106788707 [Polistes canadensis]